MLGSGSSGNAAIVQFGSITRRIVLLDAGLSPRRVREGLLHRCPPGTGKGKTMSGKVECRFGVDFLDDLALVIGAEPMTDADRMKAKVSQFLHVNGLR